MGRYTAPFQLPALFVLIAVLLVWRNQRDQKERSKLWLNGLTAATAASILFVVALFGIRDREYARFFQEAGLISPAPPQHIMLTIDEEQQRLAHVQAAIPTNEGLIAHMFVTFPFDFRRNRIFVADWMGMAGLPPGMPVGKGPQALRGYLLGHQVRYIAYDPHRVRLSVSVPDDELSVVIANPAAYGRYGWVILQSKVSLDEERNIAALATQYRHIYDDDQMYVLDLKSAR